MFSVMMMRQALYQARVNIEEEALGYCVLFTREAQAAETVWIAKEDGETNLAETSSKLLAGPKLCSASYGNILWRFGPYSGWLIFLNSSNLQMPYCPE